MNVIALKSETLHYGLAEVSGYINWLYFFHSWGYPPSYSAIAKMTPGEAKEWINSLSADDKPKAVAAAKLLADALALIADNSAKCTVTFKYSLFEAFSDCDDIVVGNGTRIPFLRQQIPGSDNLCLCLADYIAPAGHEAMDTVGVFAATSDFCSSLAERQDDDYVKFLSQTIDERLVEAAVEKSHEAIRKVKWGYAKDENLTVEELHKEKFCGIRPAVGYPSIPDLSLNFIIDDLIDLVSIGITLTENGAMSPPASVDGFMFSSPHSKYFSVGKISREQLLDYAARRGINAGDLAKFLIKNTF